MPEIAAPAGDDMMPGPGFAAETDNLEAYGKAKLARKNLDMIAANLRRATALGFELRRQRA